MTFTFEVLVSLKPGLLDPQGKAVEGSLPAMGWTNVSGVRVGKHIKLAVEAEDEATARTQVQDMAGRDPVQPGDRGLRGARGLGDVSDTPRIGVVTFPGSLDDRDALHAIEAMGGEGVALWHADHDLREVDAVVLPGGFSYGDYLRCGAIAARAPLMAEIRAFADRGRARARDLQRLPDPL